MKMFSEWAQLTANGGIVCGGESHAMDRGLSGIGTSMQNQWTDLIGFAVDKVQSMDRPYFYSAFVSGFY